MKLFSKLSKKIVYLDASQIEKVREAFDLASRAHQGQIRRTGEPYITHPTEVACIIAEMHLDFQTIMAALLHDVLEDTSVTKQELLEQFGKTVADLVDGVSKLTQVEFKTRVELQASNFTKMLIAMSEDIRVIFVKLADRLHNMRTIKPLSLQKQQRIARETLEIFAPIAKRLGMRHVYVELEDLAFQALYPRRYAVLQATVDRITGSQKRMLSAIHLSIKNLLRENHIRKATIKTREKHLYSVYRKMRDKRIPFSEIMDVHAVRIILENKDLCYRVLGLVHGLYKPISDRFKDYIALPKANDYQSLHTVLLGPYGVPIEVQIRTYEMDDTANTGIAAHWLYKITGNEVPRKEAPMFNHRWIENLLAMQENLGSTSEFIEQVKRGLFPDEIYVFTPVGDILELPGNATPVDFAYAIHTELGNRCVAAKVDRRLIPLSTPLTSGQTVEIVTKQDAVPSAAWLDYVVTGKARSAIRYKLRSQRQDEVIKLGHDLLDKALSSIGLDLQKISESKIQEVLKKIHSQDLQGLFEDLGNGNRSPFLVAQHFVEQSKQSVAIIGDEITHPQCGNWKPLIIRGTEGMMINLAVCCCPIPGDPIVGVLSAGHGVVVHIERCSEVLPLVGLPNRIIPMRWSENINQHFQVDLLVETENVRGALAMVALTVSNRQANIEDVRSCIQEGELQYFLVSLSILVADRQHLADVIRALRQLKVVMKVSRRYKEYL